MLCSKTVITWDPTVMVVANEEPGGRQPPGDLPIIIYSSSNNHTQRTYFTVGNCNDSLQTANQFVCFLNHCPSYT